MQIPPQQLNDTFMIAEGAGRYKRSFFADLKFFRFLKGTGKNITVFKTGT